MTWKTCFKKMIRFSDKGVLLAFLAAMLLSPGAWALSLDEARAAGLVGEMSTGYVGVVKSQAGVEALVSTVNQQRRQRYEEVARENGTSVQAVEALAGQKLLEKAGAGQWIKPSEQSSWIRK